MILYNKQCLFIIVMQHIKGEGEDFAAEVCFEVVVVVVVFDVEHFSALR